MSTSKSQANSKSGNQSINPQAQWHQQGPSSQQQQLSQSQQSQSTTEPYTLPGVINYLTSEFTNLERYKIMTNLEKSEMKYKIVQLQGEVNSLKFANKKQKARIEALEEENKRLKGIAGGDTADKSEVKDDFVIPEVDLSIIKNSRQQLTKSMREIVNLLKTPSSKNINYLNFPDPNDSLNNEYDVLVSHSAQEGADTDNVESLLFKELSAGKSHIAPNSIISQFFSDNNNKEEESMSDVKIPSPKFDDDVIYNDGLERVITQDSEAATMIMDDDDDDNGAAVADDRDEEFDEKEDDIPGVISPFPSPEPEINDFNDPTYEILDVYDHNNITIYLNSMTDNKQIKLTAVRKSDNKVKLSKSFNLTSSASKISNIFPISVDEEIFLLVDKQGEIKSLEVGEIPQETVLAKPAFTSVQSNDLIEFSSKSTANGKSFGLAITGASSNGFLSKIHQINYKSGDKLTSKEIGSYNKRFLTKGKNSNVTFIGWYVNDKATVTLEQSKSKSKNAVSCDDIELAPYELLYKVDDKTVELNIVSKQSSYLSAT